MDISILNPFADRKEEPQSPLPKHETLASPVPKHDLEMEYNEHKNEEKKVHKLKAPPTPSADSDFGGCISGLGSDFTKNISDTLNFMFDSNSSSSSSSSNDDKLPSHRIDVDGSVINEAWTSRPGTPDHTNGHHHHK